MKKIVLGICVALLSLSVQAEALNPNCTPQKAAKGAAMKAGVGVGGRCGVKETVGDTVGLDDKKSAVSDAKSKADDTKAGSVGRDVKNSVTP